MFIPEELRSCVAFLYVKVDNDLRKAGTCFFVGVPSAEDETSYWKFTVTALHVIRGVRSRSEDGKLWVGVNNALGEREFLATDLDQWHSHGSDGSIDLAMTAWVPPDSFSHKLIPLNQRNLATRITWDDCGIGLGAELFVTGLFVNHAGRDRNEPIVRIGNFVADPLDRIESRDFDPMDVYLVEMRSTGGLSGSPVFVHQGDHRIRDGELQTVKQVGLGASMLFFGVMHGHFEFPAVPLDPERVNMGIAIVTPIEKLIDLIESEPIRSGILAAELARATSGT